MDLHIIAGLGNPGREYEGTRHNIGFMLADALCAEFGGEWKTEKSFDAMTARVRIGPRDCLLLKPQTFMNLSGQSIGKAARYYGVTGEKIIAAHDEYQIPVGEMKITIGGGDGGHNGIANILENVGNSFVRYRLGIGSARPLESGLKGFVLAKFEASEREEITSKMPEFVSGIRLIVDRGPTIAMNHLNKRIRNNNDRNATA